MQYRQLEGNIGELKFYGNISEWWITGEDFTRTLQEMENKFATIHVRVHCYGGSVFEGTVMQTALQRCKSKVIFYIDGVAASMITQVMLYADEVIAAENAFVMVHCPTACQCGNAREMSQTAKLLASMEKNFIRNYARKSGKAEKDVQKWFDGNDYWFSADEAKIEGLIDAVETPVVDNVVELDKPTENAQEETVYSRFAALLIAPINQNLNQENSKMKKELIAQFGLTGVTENSSDAEIQAALKAHVDNSAKNNGAETVKKAVEAIIASVEKVHGKTYEASLRANLVAVGEGSGLEVLQSMLGLNAPSVDAAAAPAAGSTAASTVVPKVINLMTGGGAAIAEDRSNWSWDTWQEKDQDGLEALEKNEPEAFGAIYFKEFGRKP